MTDSMLDTMLNDAAPIEAPAPKPDPTMGNLLRADTPQRRWIHFGGEERGAPLVEAIEEVLGHTERGAREELHGADMSQATVDTNGAAYLVSGSHRLPMRAHAFGQLCREAQAPAAYLKTLPPSIATQALSYGTAKHGKAGRTIRVEGGEVRAIVSDRFSALDDRPAMRLLYRGLREAGMLDEARVDEARAGKRTTLRVSLGDIGMDNTKSSYGSYGCRAGLMFSNAELGNGALRVTGSMWDPICTNGMIFTHTGATWSRRHTGDWREQAAELGEAIKRIVAHMRGYIGKMVHLADETVSFAQLQTALKGLKGLTRTERTEATRQTLAEAMGLYDRADAEAAMRGARPEAMAEADSVMAALRDSRKRAEAVTVLDALRISKHAAVSGVTAAARDASEERQMELESAGASMLTSMLN